MGFEGTPAKTIRILPWSAFLVYLAVLLKLTLLRLPGLGLPKYALAERLRWANFVPLRSIAFYLAGNDGARSAWRNLAGNVAAFLPMGLLLPVVFPRLRGMRRALAWALAISLTLEVIQLLTGLGSFDVDDILLNVIGAAVGGLVYEGFRRALGSGGT